MRQLSGADEDRPTTQRGFALRVYVCICGKVEMAEPATSTGKGLVRSAGECRGFHLALYLSRDVEMHAFCTLACRRFFQ